ncbi:hypothetical protein GT040_14655, partial [Streptomyces sp. SID2119]|nr:hypothetical protein [Streptomyces sp. SID2119]
LDGIPSARSVLALHTQGSPVAPALLTLVADGRVRLSSGSVHHLAEPLDGLGLPVPPHTPAGRPDMADREVESLLSDGWDPSLALRIARRPEPPDPALAGELHLLRNQLDRWLAPADSSGPAALRARLLWCALRLCPAPWSADEAAVFGRYAGVVTDAFEEAVSGGGPEELAGSCWTSWTRWSRRCPPCSGSPSWSNCARSGGCSPPLRLRLCPCSGGAGPCCSAPTSTGRSPPPSWAPAPGGAHRTSCAAPSA